MAVVDMEMLMMDLAEALVLVVVTGQVVSMVVGAVRMVAMEVNLVGMEDMLEQWGPTEEILPSGMLVVTVEALAEAMILVGMGDLVRVMGHMVVLLAVGLLLAVAVPIKVAMMPPVSVVDMEGLVEVPSMGVEEDMVVLVDIILMEDRRLQPSYS